MSNLIHSAVALVLLISATCTQALVLSLDPSTVDIESGDAFSLDLVAEDLGDGIAPSIGAFDIDLLYDATALSFIDYLLGADLGAPLDSLDISFGDDGIGIVNLAEVSFLVPAALDALQTDRVLLATIMFEGDGLPGGASTAVDIGFSLVSDAFGLELPTTETRGAAITATTPPSTVPAPAMPLLLVTALALVIHRRTRQ